MNCGADLEVIGCPGRSPRSWPSKVSSARMRIQGRAPSPHRRPCPRSSALAEGKDASWQTPALIGPVVTEPGP